MSIPPVITFRIERLPPGLKTARVVKAAALVAALPLDVEVMPEKRGRYKSPCGCGIVYRIVNLSQLWERSIPMRPGAEVFVCPCMGQLIHTKLKEPSHA